MKDLERMLREPVEVRIASYSITLFKLELPSGAQIRLTQGGVYTTSDPEDIEFLSKQKGLSVTKVGDAAYRRHFTKVFSELPTVGNKQLDSESVKRFKWDTEEERELVEELRKRGYTVNEPEVETEVDYISTKDNDKKLIRPKSKKKTSTTTKTTTKKK